MMSSQVLSQKSHEGNAAQGKARYNKVMLIDDNSLDLFINKKLIESNEFATATETFQEATDALERLRTCSTDELPEVIFLDIMMPVLDGFGFLEAFHDLPAERREKMKVILLSTSESFKDLNRANKNPYVRKFLNKPLTVQVLKAIQV
jgi:CheY-like chemotaxis protein